MLWSPDVEDEMRGDLKGGLEAEMGRRGKSSILCVMISLSYFSYQYEMELCRKKYTWDLIANFYLTYSYFLDILCFFKLFLCVRLVTLGQGTKERANLSQWSMNFIIFLIYNVYKIGEGYFETSREMSSAFPWQRRTYVCLVCNLQPNFCFIKRTHGK